MSCNGALCTGTNSAGCGCATPPPMAATRRTLLRRMALVGLGAHLARGIAPAHAAEPPAATESGEPQVAPVIAFTRAVFWTGAAGFPNLLLYPSGLALTGVETPTSSIPNWQAVQVLESNAVTSAIGELGRRGFFRIRRLSSSVDLWDQPAIYLEARSGKNPPRAAFRYGRALNADGERLGRCAAFLDDFVKGLPGGEAYSPPGYEFTCTFAGTYENPPIGSEFAVKWVWREIDPLALYRAGHTEIRLPTRALPRLREIGPAYSETLALQRGYYYRIRWRPLYPHE